MDQPPTSPRFKEVRADARWFSFGSTNLELSPLTEIFAASPNVTDFSDSFRLDKMRSGNAAVYLLREQFERFVLSRQSVDVCEYIAHCFYQLEQYDDAGKWYETTGRMILSQPSAPPTVKAMDALGEYEKALECYRRNEDDEKFTECNEMVRHLKHACASA